MQPLRFLLLAALLSGACSDEKEPNAPQQTTAAASASAPAPEVDPFDAEMPSLFAPVNEEHAKNMAERKEEAAEIEKRIDEAAKVREAEFVQHVEQKLAEFHTLFAKQHAEQIQPAVDQYRADLTTKYLETLRQNYDVANSGGLAVLAQQIAEEGKRVKAGEAVPFPPGEGDAANPGMQLLFDLRRWYHDSYASIETSRKTSESTLTKNYRTTLENYYAEVSLMSPPEAGEKVKTAMSALEGEWWK